MADVTKTKNTLSIVAEFADGDDRTLTVDDPKDEYSEAQFAAAIGNLETFIATNQVILGDKNAADFARIKSAKITRGTTKYLDLSE